MHDYKVLYNQSYQEHYVWEHRAPQESLLSADSDKIDFERGHRLVLRVKDLLGEWQDWIYIAKSPFGGLGVFTSRQFPKGGLLGLCIGPEVWRADTVGTAAPTTEILKQHGVPDDVRNCSIRTAEGRMVVYSLRRDEPAIDPRPLYLGMQFAKGSKEDGVPSDQGNCQIMEDGAVLADRPISQDVELIVN